MVEKNNESLAELQQELKDKKLRAFYIFTGEEVAIRDIFVRKIVDAFGLELVPGSSLADISDRLKINPLLGGQKCYIIRNDETYQKGESNWRDAVWDSEVRNEHIVIMLYSNIDKRLKFYKHHQEAVIEFNTLSEQVLIKYILKEVNISEQHCLKLIELCESNYNRILFETNKIKMLANSQGLSHDVAFNRILEEGLIYTPVGDILFKFTDAVCLRDYMTSYKYWDKLKANESGMKVISILYNNIKSIVALQYAGKVDKICDFTGLTPWQVKLAKEKVGIFENEELIYILKMLRWCEKGIKTGLIEENIVVDYALAEIFSVNEESIWNIVNANAVEGL